jgi:IrrE N-terminal-like domain
MVTMSVARRLKASTIERRAALLLFEFQMEFGTIEHPPVPVDEILEGHLKLHLEFDNIKARWGHEGIDGLTFPATRQVVIDERLDPFEHPELEGRYRFTVAHEIGHDRLHGHLGGVHALLLGGAPGNIGSDRELEWQADKFASYLLMPKYLVEREWLAVVGHDRPLVIDPAVESVGVRNLGSRAAFIDAFANLHSRPLAELFRVSNQAMRIRLQELGLLPDK